MFKGFDFSWQAVFAVDCVDFKLVVVAVDCVDFSRLCLLLGRLC